MEACRSAAGGGVPTIKAGSQELVLEKRDVARTSGCKAVAMDIDGAGLPCLKNMTPPAGSKSVQELAEIIRYAGMPFIVKGVMTVRGAQKAAERVPVVSADEVERRAQRALERVHVTGIGDPARVVVEPAHRLAPGELSFDVVHIRSFLTVPPSAIALL